MTVVIHDSRDERTHGFADELDAVRTRPDEALTGLDETPQVQLETKLSPRALWSEGRARDTPLLSSSGTKAAEQIK
ncbi:hypothetical protein [Pandoraea commovens]|uniref:hypothetical protein n=1 Tax=Pandoraea commovens TaxID=2508289 RepID=UPI001583B995|nr:hypothetical protein [Pandoraea commovens]